MPNKREQAKGQGNDTDEATLEGGPPKQKQEWPGSDAELRPRADHGENLLEGFGRLTGRRALITGGDSGIGRAVAMAFAREGADVCIGYYDEDDDAQTVVEWIEKIGRKGAARGGDLRDPTECSALVAWAVEEMGGLDLLVNNAAVHFEVDGLDALSDDQLEQVFETNILAYFRITRAALEHLGEESCIINTGSVVALEGHATLIDYAATKGAVHVFTKSLAQQLESRTIRVNCVAPGPVWTPLIPSTREAGAVENFGSDTFRGRPAQPVELAGAYVFLASDEARFITGEILAVTGREDGTR